MHVYAVVDPDNAIAEMHEEYNKAFAVLPIKAAVVGAPPGLRTLALSAEDIMVDQPPSGGTFTISATVHAIDATFTYVAVEFWDGLPRSGGRQIGSQLIPIIPGGEARTVSVRWSAGRRARHTPGVGGHRAQPRRPGAGRQLCLHAGRV